MLGLHPALIALVAGLLVYWLLVARSKLRTSARQRAFALEARRALGIPDTDRRPLAIAREAAEARRRTASLAVAPAPAAARPDAAKALDAVRFRPVASPAPLAADDSAEERNPYLPQPPQMSELGKRGSYVPATSPAPGTLAALRRRPAASGSFSQPSPALTRKRAQSDASQSSQDEAARKFRRTAEEDASTSSDADEEMHEAPGSAVSRVLAKVPRLQEQATRKRQASEQSEPRDEREGKKIRTGRDEEDEAAEDEEMELLSGSEGGASETKEDDAMEGEDEASMDWTPMSPPLRRGSAAHAARNAKRSANSPEPSRAAAAVVRKVARKNAGARKSSEAAQARHVPSPRGKGKREPDTDEDRHIGETWTDLNGLNWRVEEDGQRTREAVVVEMRSKYNMPKTSVHPDAKLMVPVHVTRFVTEAEYAELAAQKRLGWQEAEREEERERQRLAEIERAEAERRVMDERSVRTPKKLRAPTIFTQSASGAPLRDYLSASRRVSGSPSASSSMAASTSLHELRASSSSSSLRDSVGAKPRARISLGGFTPERSATPARNRISRPQASTIDAEQRRERAEELLRALKEDGLRKKEETPRPFFGAEASGSGTSGSAASSQAAQSSSTPAAPTAAAPQPASGFSFGAAPSPAPTSSAAPAAAAPAVESKPAFSFGAAPAAAASTAAPAKPAAASSLFTFGAPAASTASAAPSAAAASAPAKPAFSFGAAPSSAAPPGPASSGGFTFSAPAPGAAQPAKSVPTFTFGK